MFNLKPPRHTPTLRIPAVYCGVFWRNLQLGSSQLLNEGPNVGPNRWNHTKSEKQQRITVTGWCLRVAQHRTCQLSCAVHNPKPRNQVVRLSCQRAREHDCIRNCHENSIGGVRGMRREHASGVTRVTIFTHNGAPQALVGCLDQLVFDEASRAIEDRLPRRPRSPIQELRGLRRRKVPPSGEIADDDGELPIDNCDAPHDDVRKGPGRHFRPAVAQSLAQQRSHLSVPEELAGGDEALSRGGRREHSAQMKVGDIAHVDVVEPEIGNAWRPSAAC